MSRYVTELTDIAPDVSGGVIQTLDLTFTHDPGKADGGLPTEIFVQDGFPWLFYSYYVNEGTVADESIGARIFYVPDDDGNLLPVMVVPTTAQYVINGEIQYYVRRHEYDKVTPALSPLAFVDANNHLVLRAKRTPDRFKDMALAGTNNFDIVASDFASKTITVQGKPYTRRHPSDDGSYARNTTYMGCVRHKRDELVGEPVVDSVTKYQQHAYAFAYLVVPGKQTVQAQYDQLADGPVIDREYVEGMTPSQHTFRITSNISEADWPQPGGGNQIGPLARQPWISPCITTQGTWAQKYYMVDIRFKLDEHKLNFSAMFGWPNYLQVNASDSFPGRPSIRFRDNNSRSAELDFFEWPGSGNKRKIHNIHAPDGGMYDHARTSGRTPVISHPEWTADAYQQIQFATEPGDAVHFDYSEWQDLRVFWWPPGNPYGKPGNSVEYYLKHPDGNYRLISGSLAPPWWNNDSIDAKQFFINHAVGGDFISGLDFSYNVGGGSSINTDQFDMRIEHIKAYQFTGEMAGGAGFPDSQGKYPNGFTRTPGDTTNSGTGIVGDPDDPVAPDPDTDNTDQFKDAVDIVAKVETLTKLGAPVALRSEVVRNTRGYTVGQAWSCTLPAAWNWSIQDTSAEDTLLTFDVPAGTTLTDVQQLFANAVMVKAVELDGPGTSPVITGRTQGRALPAETVPDTVPPTEDDPNGGIGDPVDPGGEDPGPDGGPTVTVTSTGPVVTGTTTNIGGNRTVWVGLSGHVDGGIGTVTEADGSWSLSGIPAAYDGTLMLAYVTQSGGTEASGGQFTFTA